MITKQPRLRVGSVVGAKIRVWISRALPVCRWLCSPPVILSLVFLFVYSIVVYIGNVRRPPRMPVVVVVGGGGSNPFGRLVSFRISQRS